MARPKFNTKREVESPPNPESLAELAALASRVHYAGSKYHKRNPGDFGLEPPMQPRPDKQLCDGAAIFKKAEATRLLQDGVRVGLVSTQRRNGFPQNIWSVRGGLVFEAELENETLGSYHGYPLQAEDPFQEVVLARVEK
jgi:hypothetical protein